MALRPGPFRLRQLALWFCQTPDMLLTPLFALQARLQQPLKEHVAKRHLTVAARPSRRPTERRLKPFRELLVDHYRQHSASSVRGRRKPRQPCDRIGLALDMRLTLRGIG